MYLKTTQAGACKIFNLASNNSAPVEVVLLLVAVFLIMTAVEFLAEKYNYITWMRNRDEISAGTADEWRAKFLNEAKEMEQQQLNKAWQEGAVTAQKDAAKEIEKNYVARLGSYCCQ